MKEFVLWIRHNTDWLYYKIFETNFFFIDFWSFAHFTSGLLLFLILSYFNFKNKFIIISTILFFYELIEILIVFFTLNIFKPESIKDQFTDLFIGLFGALISKVLFNKIKSYEPINKKNLIRTFSIVFVSIQISFWWVGSYGYTYNFSYLNSNGLNYFAFSGWCLFLIIIGFLFYFLKERNNNLINPIILTYLSYFIILFLIEYIAFYILGIKESSSKEKLPLIFGLIHGTLILHIVYLLNPLFLLIGVKVINKLFKI
ncbi:MAG: hypothetical protein N2321_00185 [Melioribacteraceae bacterium]|nr:hypothetical protein [Melioribacteraceae bacterium]